MCMWPMQSYRAPYSKGLCAWGLMLCGCLLEILNNLSLNLCFKWSLVGQGGMCPGFRTSNYMWSYLQLPPYDGFLATCYQLFGTLNLACLLPPCLHLMSPLPPLGSGYGWREAWLCCLWHHGQGIVVAIPSLGWQCHDMFARWFFSGKPFTHPGSRYHTEHILAWNLQLLGGCMSTMDCSSEHSAGWPEGEPSYRWAA